MCSGEPATGSQENKMGFLKLFVLASVLVGCMEAAPQPDLETVTAEGKTTGSTTPPPGPTCPTTTDYMSDPSNCGTCGTVCGSGLCYAGVCADATAGHVFVIGHGYATSNAALDKILGNAVFSSDRSTVRVLAYIGQTPASLVTGTNAAMARAATARGRTITRTTITGSADVAVNLPNNDVFVIYAQTLATSDYLAALGNEWAYRMDSFARRGGIIVVLDAPSANSGTPQVLVQSGLLALGGRAATSAVGYVAVAEDMAATRLPLMFALANGVGWTTSTWTDVATSDTGQAVVVHRAIY